jgi:hypothetical protein
MSASSLAHFLLEQDLTTSPMAWGHGYRYRFNLLLKTLCISLLASYLAASAVDLIHTLAILCRDTRFSVSLLVAVTTCVILISESHPLLVRPLAITPLPMCASDQPDQHEGSGNATNGTHGSCRLGYRQIGWLLLWQGQW